MKRGTFGSKALAGKINQQTLDVVTVSGYTNGEALKGLVEMLIGFLR